MSESLYEYRTPLIHGGQQTSVVVQGRREFIEQFIPQHEFRSLFGGSILSRAADSDQEFLGVWGVRTASRFRGLLRARGAVFSVVRSETAPFRPKVLSVSHDPHTSTGSA